MEKTEITLQAIVAGLSDILKKEGLPHGFALIIFEFHKPSIANYISNAQRDDMIKALKETVHRLEKNEIIPPTI